MECTECTAKLVLHDTWMRYPFMCPSAGNNCRLTSVWTQLEWRSERQEEPRGEEMGIGERTRF